MFVVLGKSLWPNQASRRRPWEPEGRSVPGIAGPVEWPVPGRKLGHGQPNTGQSAFAGLP